METIKDIITVGSESSEQQIKSASNNNYADFRRDKANKLQMKLHRYRSFKEEEGERERECCESESERVVS